MMDDDDVETINQEDQQYIKKRGRIFGEICLLIGLVIDFFLSLTLLFSSDDYSLSNGNMEVLKSTSMLLVYSLQQALVLWLILIIRIGTIVYLLYEIITLRTSFITNIWLVCDGISAVASVVPIFLNYYPGMLLL